MNLEKAKELNGVLKPFGYTVGRIAQELEAYDNAIKICNIDHNYEKANEIEKELNEIRYEGIKDVPRWDYFLYRNVLKNHGVDD